MVFKTPLRIRLNSQRTRRRRKAGLEIRRIEVAKTCPFRTAQDFLEAFDEKDAEIEKLYKLIDRLNNCILALERQLSMRVVSSNKADDVKTAAQRLFENAVRISDRLKNGLAK